MQLLRLFSFETPPLVAEQETPQSAGADVSEALADGQAATSEAAAAEDSAPAAEAVAVGTPGEGGRRASVAAAASEGADAAASQPPA